MMMCVCDAERLVVFTFAHPAVFPQHVSRWTFAFVRSHRVDTAERTQQGILGTLVDILKHMTCFHQTPVLHNRAVFQFIILVIS